MRIGFTTVVLILLGVCPTLAQSVDNLLQQVGHYCPSVTSRYYEISYKEYGCNWDTQTLMEYDHCQNEADAINKKIRAYNDWMRKCDETSGQSQRDQAKTFDYKPGQNITPNPSEKVGTPADPQTSSQPIDPLDAMLAEATKGAQGADQKNAASLAGMKSQMAKQTGGSEISDAALKAQIASHEASAEEEGRRVAAEEAAAAQQRSVDAYIAALDNYGAQVEARRRLEEDRRLEEYNAWVRQQRQAEAMRVFTGLIGGFISSLAQSNSGGGYGARSTGGGGGWECDGNPGSCAAY